MRAAEILAEALLMEAVYGILFGPKIPKEGYWVKGDNFHDMVGKIAVQYGAGEKQQTPTFLSTIISSGYSLVTSANGRVDVYGFEVPDVSEKGLYILNVQGSTPVFHTAAVGKPAVQLTGKDAFGVALTPEEKEKLKAKKADAKKGRTNLTPEEEDEFRTWADKHAAATGSPAGNLATMAPGPTP